MELFLALRWFRIACFQCQVTWLLASSATLRMSLGALHFTASATQATLHRLAPLPSLLLRYRSQASAMVDLRITNTMYSSFLVSSI